MSKTLKKPWKPCAICQVKTVVRRRFLIWRDAKLDYVVLCIYHREAWCRGLKSAARLMANSFP